MNTHLNSSTHENDIALEIVKQIIGDMQGRYVVDAIVFSANDRDEVNVKVTMFEEWRRIVSQLLYDNRFLEKIYQPKSRDELMSMSLAEILERRDVYLGRL